MDLNTHKFQRLFSRLDNSINNKEFYEAHQASRTLFNRLKKDEPEKCIYLLGRSAHFLLINKQSESGSDLATELVNYFATIKRPLTEENIVHLKSYFSLMNKLSEERKSYLQACQKLFNGLHQERKYFYNWIAIILWKEKNYAAARYHFIKSENGIHLAFFLIHLTSSGVCHEFEKVFLITQAVLQFLCLNKFESAIKTYLTFIKNVSEFQSGPPYKNYPLLNFLWLLLLAIKTNRDQSDFIKIRDNYVEHLKQDPSYEDYLIRIGQEYFGIPRENNQTSFIDNVFNALLGGNNPSDQGVTSTTALQDANFSLEDEMD